MLEQRIGRIHRLGQKRPIDVYNLTSRACIEERIAALVGEKKALFKGLFDGSTDEIRFDRRSALLGVFERITGFVPAATSSAAKDAPEEGTDLDPLMPEPGDDRAASLPGLMAGVGAAIPQPADPSVSPVLAATSGAEVGRLFEALRVERRADGGIRIEAPPQTAHMSLFAGMARVMAAAPATSHSATNGAPGGRPSAA